MSPIEIFLIVLAFVYALAAIFAICYVTIFCFNKCADNDKDEYINEKLREQKSRKKVQKYLASNKNKYNDSAIKVYDIVDKNGEQYVCFSKEDQKDVTRINSKLIRPYAYLEISSYGEVFMLEKTYFRLNSFQRSKLTEYNNLTIISLNV